MKWLIIALCFYTGSLNAEPHPDCSGTERWPTMMAFVQMKNDGITDNNKINFEKTKTIRIASEEIEGGLYKQVHKIEFYEKGGVMYDIITINNSSHQECSMSAVEVYVVSKKLGNK